MEFSLKSPYNKIRSFLTRCKTWQEVVWSDRQGNQKKSKALYEKYVQVYTHVKEEKKETQIESQYQERLAGLNSIAFWPVNVTWTVIWSHEIEN